MTFNKQSFIALLVVVLLFTSFQPIHAYAFRDVFGIEKVGNTQPVSSIGATSSTGGSGDIAPVKDPVPLPPVSDSDPTSFPPVYVNQPKVLPPITSGNTVTATDQTSSTCAINSFNTPTSTTIASGLSVTVSWSSNCNHVVLEANSGSYTLRYVGGANGTHTFSAPPGTNFSNTDNQMEISLIATNGTDTVSSTAGVTIIDAPNPSTNQCSIAVTVPPVTLGQPFTLSWWTDSTPSPCIVYVEKVDVNGNFSHIFKPGTYYFNGADSVTQIFSGPATYYLTSQTGADNTTVLSANTVDVDAQLNEKVYLMGGTGIGTVLKDVWVSSQPSVNNWTLLTNNATWGQPNTFTPKGVYFNNKLWVVTGDGNSAPPQVSYSTDGITWTNAPTPPWAPRDNHAVAVFNDGGGDAIWVIGGQNGGALYYDDIWKTYDGTTWTQVTGNAPWGGISSHNLLSYNGELWVVGGRSPVDPDVFVLWHSSDGINWTQGPTNIPLGLRSHSSVVVFNNKMWVLGGTTLNGDVNDVWYSSDGVSWTQATANATWQARHYQVSVVFDNKMWILGGIVGPGAMNDVWYSSDGVSWSPASPLQAPWSARATHTAIVTP